MQIYTVGQAAEVLSVSDQTIRTWLRDGTLKGSKIGSGKIWRIASEAIVEFMKSGEPKANETQEGK